ncbi:hypothetical protein, partial [Neoaquamicrobium sediminum]|uniref:hypothetical protein n=1 Tax=Neoaquamicrobium sediminum TaxID=1849104 RepID=UPI004035B894
MRKGIVANSAMEHYRKEIKDLLERLLVRRVITSKTMKALLRENVDKPRKRRSLWRVHAVLSEALVTHDPCNVRKATAKELRARCRSVDVTAYERGQVASPAEPDGSAEEAERAALMEMVEQMRDAEQIPTRSIAAMRAYVRDVERADVPSLRRALTEAMASGSDEVTVALVR